MTDDNVPVGPPASGDSTTQGPGATRTPNPPATPEQHRRSVRNAAMLTAGMGIAFSILFYIAVFLTAGVPGARATDEDLYAFYTSGNATPVTVGLYVMPFAGIAFIWFSVALRMWSAASATRTENVLQSNVQLVSGIAFVVITFIAAAAGAVLAASVQLGGGIVDPTIARQFPVFSNVLNLFFGMRMAAMFTFTTSGLARASGILPRWFVYLGFLVGLFLLLTTVLSPLLVLVFPTWILILCLLLLREARRIPADLRLPATAPVGFRRPIDIAVGEVPGPTAGVARDEPGTVSPR